MEEVFLRFPHLSEDIFNNLDNETLANCEEASKVWFAHLDDQNFLRLKRVEMIKETIGKFHQLDDNGLYWTYEFHAAFDTTRVKKILDAARMGDFEASQKYMMEGIEHVYHKDDAHRHTNSNTPLRWAASIGCFDIVKFIVENTKDSGYPEKTKRSTGVGGLFDTLRYFKYKISEFMSKNSYTPLHIAAGLGHFDIVKYLLDKLYDKNPRDNCGGTPLHYAARWGHLNICKYLISEINDKNPKDRYGDTPLHIAARIGHLEIVMCIMDNIEDKIPKNKRSLGYYTSNDWYGFTPLHMAAMNGHLDIVKCIMDNIEDKSPKT